MMLWDKDALKDLPTLHQGQCCDCKVDTGQIRVWICRVAGGITIEQYKRDSGRWEQVAGSCIDVEVFEP